MCVCVYENEKESFAYAKPNLFRGTESHRKNFHVCKCVCDFGGNTSAYITNRHEYKYYTEKNAEENEATNEFVHVCVCVNVKGMDNG